MRLIFIFGMSARRSEGRASVAAAPAAREEKKDRRFMGDKISKSSVGSGLGKTLDQLEAN